MNNSDKLSLIAHKLRSLTERFSTSGSHQDSEEAGRLVMRAFRLGCLQDIIGLSELVSWVENPPPRPPNVQAWLVPCASNLFTELCGFNKVIVRNEGGNLQAVSGACGGLLPQADPESFSAFPVGSYPTQRQKQEHDALICRWLADKIERDGISRPAEVTVESLHDPKTCAAIEQFEQLSVGSLAVQLEPRRKGKLLALEVSARISSADQKCFEIPATEDEGLDMELEFTDDEGKGTGKRLFLQLKSGNSHLRRRKKDGVEVFAIKEQRWVDYWLKQPHPVMLVIGTFADGDEQTACREKLEFADVRWMEVSSYLKRESQNGTKPVKQIEFKGERLDMTSVYRWRDTILSQVPR